jgi:exodeoxyribonuclease VII small subunit
MNVNELSYEQSYERLEEIVERMSSASAPLEELMKLYEEGMALAKHCETLLNGYDARLEMIARKAEDEPSEEKTEDTF